MTDSKVTDLQDRADVAYEAEDQAWFDALPDADLGVLWGLACAGPMGTGVSYDDEVFDALDKRGWFEKPVSDSSDTTTKGERMTSIEGETT